MRGLVLALLASAILAPAADAQATTARPLAVGDFFEVRDRIGEPSGATQDRIVRQTVEAVEPLEVGNETYLAARMRIDFLGGASTYVELPEPAKMWVRVSDGADLRREMSEGTVGSRSVETFDEPCVSLRHPLVVGDEWVSRCVSTTTTTREGEAPRTHTQTRTTSYRVLRVEEVTVPAGTFEAYLVESNTTENSFDIRPQQHWYAPAACTLVKTISVQGAGYSDTFELMSFRCAAVEGGGGQRDAIPAPPLVAALALVLALGLRWRSPPRTSARAS